MEIIKSFGVNGYLLGAQIINFLILLFLLKKFAYKPIFKMLEKRKEEIAKGQKNAEEANKALENALEEEKKILKKAQANAAQILLDAKNQADTVLSDAKEETKSRVEQMMVDAKSEINKEAAEIEKKLALSSAHFAVEMVEKSIKDIFTTKEQKETITKLAKKLKTK